MVERDPAVTNPIRGILLGCCASTEAAKNAKPKQIAKTPRIELPDNPVGSGQDISAYCQSNLFCGFEIDDQLEFSRLLHWQIGGFGAF
jgi:hypothetical protein